MLTLPTVIERAARPYVAIRSTVTMDDLGTVGAEAHDELFRWLAERGIAGDGLPFFKYDVVDMARSLQMEFGIVTAAPVEGDGRVVAGTLPAGQFASVVYTGSYADLYDVNAALIGWARERGFTWDSQATPEGERFACRLEIYLTDPALEPDPNLWETEVAIKIAEADGAG
ncbi:GyrI-like domain-containing protein [Oceanibacterium hippocampi]|uniref:Bacterial transcription activator, effector binding domain n=1 Tax=Oceanibacterium hippocampi TaxID=745714 RepID=A0A1Y5RZA8_9PROT|nr:GyrI-like domain-containing protein [Oceanibacterium hippocampi]SLN27605.1 Bacterial transcription activator, effector binding domain [Oceanibacterium hippocampi]